MGEFGSFSSPESRRPFPAEWCSQSGLMWLFFSPSSLFFTDCCMLLFFPRAVVCTLLSRCCELWIKKMLLHSVLRSVVTAGTLVQPLLGGAAWTQPRGPAVAGSFLSLPCKRPSALSRQCRLALALGPGVCWRLPSSWTLLDPQQSQRCPAVGASAKEGAVWLHRLLGSAASSLSWTSEGCAGG